MARLCRRNQGRFLVERFSVKEQAVHVEDNGGGHVRELHIAGYRTEGRIGTWPGRPVLNPAARNAQAAIVNKVLWFAQPMVNNSVIKHSRA